MYDLLRDDIREANQCEYMSQRSSHIDEIPDIAQQLNSLYSKRSSALWVVKSRVGIVKANHCWVRNVSSHTRRVGASVNWQVHACDLLLALGEYYPRV